MYKLGTVVVALGEDDYLRLPCSEPAFGQGLDGTRSGGLCGGRGDDVDVRVCIVAIAIRIFVRA